MRFQSENAVSNFLGVVWTGRDKYLVCTNHNFVFVCLLGVITSFVVDPCHSWLTVGTSAGMLVCWDLRFQLPITNLSHPRGNVCVLLLTVK